MTKTLTEAHITTAKARSKLEFGVHWRRLDAEAHLGYRKGKRSGIWFVRWRNHHDGANYKQAPVGVANDVNDKPAEGTLTFEQAVTQAREHATRSRTEAAAQAAGPAPTVRTAVETYIRERNARDSRRAARGSIRCWSPLAALRSWSRERGSQKPLSCLARRSPSARATGR